MPSGASSGLPLVRLGVPENEPLMLAPLLAELSATMVLTNARVPPALLMPPPTRKAELPASVQLVRAAVPR